MQALGLLAVAAVFFALHFLHLSADFPNDSPWVDWSKYTDEGWYGDAAIRHVLFGHWYWKGDFNPAVALPVWPALELLVFRVVGVSAVAARALTLGVFAVTLVAARVCCAGRGRSPRRLLCCCFASARSSMCSNAWRFLEPLLCCLTLLAMLVAGRLTVASTPHEARSALPDVATLVAFDRAWRAAAGDGAYQDDGDLPDASSGLHGVGAGGASRARAATDWRDACRARCVVVGSVFALFVHPHYLVDYQYLFSANAYTGIGMQPLTTVLSNTVADGRMDGTAWFIRWPTWSWR